MRWRALFLLLVFVGLPILEIYVIVKVGEAIGAWPTVGLLILESAIGLWVVKREGRRAFRALSDAIGRGELPSRELADAIVVLIGGFLLITPGFVTDVIGFFFVLPLTRPIARRLLGAIVSRRLLLAADRHVARSRGGVHQIYDDDLHRPRLARSRTPQPARAPPPARRPPAPAVCVVYHASSHFRVVICVRCRSVCAVDDANGEPGGRGRVNRRGRVNGRGRESRRPPSSRTAAVG